MEKPKLKHQILHLLKVYGPQTAATLADQLQVSPMAVRQHLQGLKSKSWVTYQEEHRAVGRPVKLWQLTEQSTPLFPDGHGDLLVQILRYVQQFFGTEGLTVVLAERTSLQLHHYTTHLVGQQTDDWDWRSPVLALAKLRDQEGYMAEVIPQAAQALLLVENHCAICKAAEHCPQLCQSELELFSQLLGSTVTVQRVEHIMAGDRRCAYRITPVE